MGRKRKYAGSYFKKVGKACIVDKGVLKIFDTGTMRLTTHILPYSEFFSKYSKEDDEVYINNNRLGSYFLIKIIKSFSTRMLNERIKI